ncbi:MAG: 5'-methylthioadenosine/adenosylhomocysteine nucleosidase [Treponema sp.]|nr:5'-methylthioadenosine/adenosylhomocysteine nucleosidase [Treponema sp.]
MKKAKKVGIIGAMSVEVETLVKKLKPVQKGQTVTAVEAGGLTFWQGLLEGTEVVIVKSGIGKVNAALCAQRLVMQFGVTHIINTGIAGAMASGLGILDMVVSKDAVYHDFEVTAFGYKQTKIPQMKTSTFKADKKMIDAATIAFAGLKEAAGHQMVVGRVASGDQFICDARAKDAIRKICKPACVEMEGAAIAHAAYLNKVPFVIIRCMSDMADDAGGKTYSFNENKAAALSAKLVCAMLTLF